MAGHNHEGRLKMVDQQSSNLGGGGTSAGVSSFDRDRRDRDGIDNRADLSRNDLTFPIPVRPIIELQSALWRQFAVGCEHLARAYENAINQVSPDSGQHYRR